MRKTLIRILGAGVVFVLVLVVAIVVVRLRAVAFWADAEAHLAANQRQLLLDTKALIGEAIDTSVRPADARNSLAVPGLKLIEVRGSHVNLILYTSPDTTSGYRVWVADPPADFQDRSTSVSFIRRYSYCDDYPIAPDNRP